MSLVSRKELLKVGTKVWISTPFHGKETRFYGQVLELLASQFTIDMEGDDEGSVRFKFYTDRDWGIVEEANG